MVATIGTVALLGLRAHPVRVECSTGPGLPGTRVIGLPDAAIRESSDRVKTAVQRAGLDWPGTRVVVNLAPAALPKTGAGFDLPVALGVLATCGVLDPAALRGSWAFGELGLDGTARAVPGTLAVAREVARRGGRLLVPDAAATEAALIDDLTVIPVADLSEAVQVITGEAAAREVLPPVTTTVPALVDLAEVRGQALGRRAIELAAAGGHHLLLVGPPGCGKSMLAERLPTLLPDLDLDQALEVAAVHSVAGERPLDAPLSRRPPLRTPHHSTSGAGLVGGGAPRPRPGELSLAHHGVLFLDELLEVPRHILDALRQPLERREVVIVRASGVVRFPADVQLVAATNPCPCGYAGSDIQPCRCRPDQVDRYRARLSGPLLDRLDLQVELLPVDRERLIGPPDGEDSATVTARVAAARAAAADRWRPGATVARAPSEAVRRTASSGALRGLLHAADGLGLSARGFDRALRVARTIADLDGAVTIERAHVDEAVAYRLAPAVPV